MIPKMLTTFTLTPTLPLWMPALHSVISWSGVMHCRGGDEHLRRSSAISTRDTPRASPQAACPENSSSQQRQCYTFWSLPEPLVVEPGEACGGHWRRPARNAVRLWKGFRSH